MDTTIFPDWAKWAGGIVLLGWIGRGYWAALEGKVKEAAAKYHAAEALKTNLSERLTTQDTMLTRVASEQTELRLLVTEVKTKLIGLNGGNGLIGDLRRIEDEKTDTRHILRNELTTILMTGLNDLSERLDSRYDGLSGRISSLERKSA